jgi:hypothetical protein
MEQTVLPEYMANKQDISDTNSVTVPSHALPPAIPQLAEKLAAQIAKKLSLHVSLAFSWPDE